jgi:hypothetical protein
MTKIEQIRPWPQGFLDMKSEDGKNQMDEVRCGRMKQKASVAGTIMFLYAVGL